MSTFLLTESTLAQGMGFASAALGLPLIAWLAAHRLQVHLVCSLRRAGLREPTARRSAAALRLIVFGLGFVPALVLASRWPVFAGIAGALSVLVAARSLRHGAPALWTATRLWSSGRIEMGDIVSHDNFTGQVTGMGLTGVTVASRSGGHKHIAYPQVTGPRFTNHTARGGTLHHARVRLTAPHDIVATRVALMTAARAVQSLARAPRPSLSLVDWSSDACSYDLRLWCSDLPPSEGRLGQAIRSELQSRGADAPSSLISLRLRPQ